MLTEACDLELALTNSERKYYGSSADSPANLVHFECLWCFGNINSEPNARSRARVRYLFVFFTARWLNYFPFPPTSTETQAHPHRPEELCVSHLRQTFQGGRRAPAPPAGPHWREALPVPALPHALCRAQHTAAAHQTQTPLPPSSHGNAEREKRRQPGERGWRIGSAGGGGERWMVQLHCV